MKIPSYRKQISYRRTAARDVALAQPLPEAAGSGGLWLDAAQMLGSSAAGAGRIMVRKKKEWESEAARQNPTPSKPHPPKAGKAAAFRAGFSETAEEASAAVAQFSSEDRGRMLSYCRTNVFEPDCARQSAPEKLDAYFMELRSGGQKAGREDLLTHDYVIMRKEVERLSAAHDAREQTRRFNRGAGNFVQTAAMVRTPRALEEYIAANLSAAKEEASSPQERWPLQESALRAAAVRHNIEAALGAGEAEQAQRVLAHFEKSFSERELGVLRRKVTSFRASAAAQRCEGAAYAACRTRDGETDEKKLLSWAEENGGNTGVARQDLFHALQARFAAREREQLRRRAKEYERLACAGEEDHAGALAASCVSDRGEYDRLLRAVRESPQRQSERSAYNALYERVLSGSAEEKELDGAFEKGSLSSRDYLRLKSASCRWRAGDGETQERLLMCAAEDLCRGRTEKEAEEIKYFIFSSPGGAAGKLQAASQAKRILNLQEKKA